MSPSTLISSSFAAMPGISAVTVIVLWFSLTEIGGKAVKPSSTGKPSKKRLNMRFISC